jgi:hypothetical protein
MAIRLLPVIGEPLPAKCEHAAGEIGAIDSRQNEETGVIGHQRETAAALGDVAMRELCPKAQNMCSNLAQSAENQIFADF